MNKIDKNKEMKKKFFEQRPKYSQMELRAMERKRTARLETAMGAKVKREQEFWGFCKKDREKKEKNKI